MDEWCREGFQKLACGKVVEKKGKREGWLEKILEHAKTHKVL
jgi:hypothetical protein